MCILSVAMACQGQSKRNFVTSTCSSPIWHLQRLSIYAHMGQPWILCFWSCSSLVHPGTQEIRWNHPLCQHPINQAMVPTSVLSGKTSSLNGVPYNPWQQSLLLWMHSLRIALSKQPTKLYVVGRWPSLTPSPTCFSFGNTTNSWGMFSLPKHLPWLPPNFFWWNKFACLPATQPSRTLSLQTVFAYEKKHEIGRAHVWTPVTL